MVQPPFDPEFFNRMLWYAMVWYDMVWNVWYAMVFLCYAMRFVCYAMLWFML